MYTTATATVEAATAAVGFTNSADKLQQDEPIDEDILFPKGNRQRSVSRKSQSVAADKDASPTNTNKQVVGKYELGKALAVGDFDCRTRLCTHIVTGATYVVRIYAKAVLAEAEWMWNRVRASIHVQRTLPKHDNIVEMVECFETRASLYILMQLFASENLASLMRADRARRKHASIGQRWGSAAHTAQLTHHPVTHSEASNTIGNQLCGRSNASISQGSFSTAIHSTASNGPYHGLRATSTSQAPQLLVHVPHNSDWQTASPHANTTGGPIGSFETSPTANPSVPLPFSPSQSSRYGESEDSPRGRKHRHRRGGKKQRRGKPSKDGNGVNHPTSTRAMPIHVVRSIFENVVKGTLHMHARNVVHLGIAPDHILVNVERAQVKISNLISCCFCPRGRRMTELKGTRHTVAPEVLRKEPYDPYLADAWSLGVLLYFLLNDGHYPHDGANTVKHILYGHIRPCRASAPAAAKDLVARLMQAQPSERLTVEAILLHPFMTDPSYASPRGATADEGPTSHSPRGHRHRAKPLRADSSATESVVPLQELEQYRMAPSGTSSRGGIGMNSAAFTDSFYAHGEDCSDSDDGSYSSHSSYSSSSSSSFLSSEEYDGEDDAPPFGGVMDRTAPRTRRPPAESDSPHTRDPHKALPFDSDANSEKAEDGHTQQQRGTRHDDRGSEDRPVRRLTAITGASDRANGSRAVSLTSDRTFSRATQGSTSTEAPHSMLSGLVLRPSESPSPPVDAGTRNETAEAPPVASSPRRHPSLKNGSPTGEPSAAAPGATQRSPRRRGSTVFVDDGVHRDCRRGRTGSDGAGGNNSSRSDSFHDGAGSSGSNSGVGDPRLSNPGNVFGRRRSSFANASFFSANVAQRLASGGVAGSGMGSTVVKHSTRRESHATSFIGFDRISADFTSSRTSLAESDPAHHAGRKNSTSLSIEGDDDEQDGKVDPYRRRGSQGTQDRSHGRGENAARDTTELSPTTGILPSASPPPQVPQPVLVKSSWDQATGTYRLQLPMSLSLEEQAALVIQFCFREYRQRRRFREETQLLLARAAAVNGEGISTPSITANGNGLLPASRSSASVTLNGGAISSNHTSTGARPLPSFANQRAGLPAAAATTSNATSVSHPKDGYGPGAIRGFSRAASLRLQSAGANAAATRGGMGSSSDSSPAVGNGGGNNAGADRVHASPGLTTSTPTLLSFRRVQGTGATGLSGRDLGNSSPTARWNHEQRPQQDGLLPTRPSWRVSGVPSGASTNASRLRGAGTGTAGLHATHPSSSNLTALPRYFPGAGPLPSGSGGGGGGGASVGGQGGLPPLHPVSPTSPQPPHSLHLSAHLSHGPLLGGGGAMSATHAHVHALGVFTPECPTCHQSTLPKRRVFTKPYENTHYEFKAGAFVEAAHEEEERERKSVR